MARGTEFQRRRSDIAASGLHYVSVQHFGTHETQTYLADMCGTHLEMVTKYLYGFAAQRGKNPGKIRSAIAPFTRFLTERGILDLERVKPKTITEFISWSEEMDYKKAAHDISVLAGFFKWAIREGHRKASCPVIPEWHGKKRSHYLPRPYTVDEMALIWRLALDRGNSRVRAIVAIGEEAGLRIGEMCRLRVEDVDLRGRRLFVGLPNKTDCERWALFSDKAEQYIKEWLQDRDKDCAHDFLFHNTLGGPLLVSALQDEWSRTFCRKHEGKAIHVEGLDAWSTHRLRHTMASNLAAGGASFPTIMGAGGWKSESSALHYIRTKEALARRGYDEAMRRANEQAQCRVSSQTLTMEEFLSRHAGTEKN